MAMLNTQNLELYQERNIDMDKKPEFHGSDLEKIEEYYHIPKEEIICFSANVNPLGLSKKVKKELASNLDVITGSLTVEYQKSTHRSHKTCFFYVKFSVSIAVILCYCMV